MISANLIINTAPYTNENAISNTINYICRFDDDNIFFYGNWPPTKESAIEFFESLRSFNSLVTSPQKVQHFEVTFKSYKDETSIKTIANNVALLFAPAFPICFALHNEADHMHVHFILSTTSAIPGHPPLVGGYWKKAVQSIQNLIKNSTNFDLTTIYKSNDTSKKSR